MNGERAAIDNVPCAAARFIAHGWPIKRFHSAINRAAAPIDRALVTLSGIIAPLKRATEQPVRDQLLSHAGDEKSLTVIDNREASPQASTEHEHASMVEVRGLKKSYGLKPILRGVDLTLLQGERMALLGANGAGKTTLLRLLAGLTQATAGTIRIAGLNMVQDAQQIRSLVGFVAHQPYLYEELTALENLLFFGRMYGIAHARERACSLLQRVGLERRMHERARTLSRGQLQRLAWARALLHEPSLLLLDEPDTGLDQEGCALIDSLQAEHNARGGSAIFTTHQLERALAFSDKIVILRAGRLVYEAATAGLTPEELQQAYQEAAR
ncbi:MAG TPA: heme ABC exporter ATP-binding protein CcmA [Ktedonobacteraceae bacterium]|nr:heme ABC exporter ATP-binding protein CcmA [Ktedonobacteraceae bacterium]